MSSIPQTAAPNRPGFVRTFALTMVIVAVVVGAAMAPVGRQVLAAAGHVRPHPLDLGLFASLSPVIKLHLLAALVALALGAVLMFARKGRRFHRVAGWTWAAW